MSAAERMRRYRLRLMGKHDGVSRTCGVCNAILSIHNEIDSHTCAACYRTSGETCKRGHSLESYARIVKRGARFTTVCSECKRIRDREYAINRRARQRLS
jgi:hypothetical protein